MPIKDIEPTDIVQVCRATLRKENIRAQEFANARAILKAVYAYAESHGLIPPDKKNAFERADFSPCLNALAHTPSIEKRGFTDLELMRLKNVIAAAIKERPNYFPAYALLLQMLQGLRRREGPALKWSDIQHGVMTIQRTDCAERVQGQKESFYIAETTKAGYSREIPITQRGQELLDQIRAIHEKLGIQSDFLFPADNDLGIISLNSVQFLCPYVQACRRED